MVRSGSRPSPDIEKAIQQTSRMRDLILSLREAKKKYEDKKALKDRAHSLREAPD